MTTTDPTFDAVLTLARRLSLADQMRLVVALAAEQTSPPASHKTGTNAPDVDDFLAQLPPDSPAGKLIRDPNSALAHVLALLPNGFTPPTDEDIARWRDERLTERYGA
jgi:hypothetical protein